MPAFSIGDFDFFSISRLPVGPSRQGQLDQRPGVDGTGFYRNGTFGQPQRVACQVDVSTLAAALSLLDQYRAAKWSDPVPVVYSDQTLDFDVVVLEVLPARPPQELPNCTGGINVSNGNPAVWLTTVWDLMPVTKS